MQKKKMIGTRHQSPLYLSRVDGGYENTQEQEDQEGKEAPSLSRQSNASLGTGRVSPPGGTPVG